MHFQFSDRKPPGVGRGRGRGGREEGPGGRTAKGIGRGVDEGGPKGAGGRGRGGPGGRIGGGRGMNHIYLFPPARKQSKTIIWDIYHYGCLCDLLDLPFDTTCFISNP